MNKHHGQANNIEELLEVDRATRRSTEADLKLGAPC